MKPKILKVILDNDIDRESLMLILKRAGFSCSITKSKEYSCSKNDNYIMLMKNG